MYFVRATAVLVLIGGCGGGTQPQEPKTSEPQHAARTAEAPPAPTQAAPQPASAPPPAPAPSPAPWRDCGRILSPLDRRPHRVEARTFDCREGRRVAVRYLRNGSLPQGWGPGDCAASRAACEQGGWGFRLVEK